MASFDSQLKWAAHLADELAARGFANRFVAPRESAALSDAQVAAAGVTHVDLVPRSRLVEESLEHDVVVYALAGPVVRELTLDLSERVRATGGPGPVVVAGWVGVIIEKITAGYLDRSGADVVAVNAAHELEHFRHVAATLDIDDSNLLLSGLPILSTSPQPQRDGAIRTLVFADQPTVPGSPVDRLHVYRRLLAYARRHPDRQVLLKPRHRPGEDTFHHAHHPPEVLLANEDLPGNFAFDYRPVTTLLEEADLLVTMSSTACLEAIDRGRRVALVLDLGVHERYGNHVFVDSGLLRTFDQIEDDDLGTPAPAWVESWFGGRDTGPVQAVADRVEKLLATGERPSHVALASAYQQGALALHHARRSAPTVPGPGLWQRRRRLHGTVKGTAVHVGLDWVPPAVQRPVRRWWRARG